MDVRPVAAAALALALAGCGESMEEKRVKQLKSMCEASVGQTIADLETAYGSSIRIAACGESVSSLECTATPPLCQLGFWFPPSNDQNVCEQTGCYFACDVRAQLEDLRAHEEDHEAVVCGKRWVDGQPSPGPYYYAPVWAPGMLP